DFVELPAIARDGADAAASHTPSRLSSLMLRAGRTETAGGTPTVPRRSLERMERSTVISRTGRRHQTPRPEGSMFPAAYSSSRIRTDDCSPFLSCLAGTPPLPGQCSHGGLEGPAARRIVRKHVEAR